MKYLLILSTVLIFGLSVMVTAQEKPKDEKIKVETQTFEVEGMTCQSCVNAVETKLGKIDGVEKYDVNLEKGEAVVEFDPNKVNTEKIEKAFEKTPYKVTEKEKESNSDKQKE